MKKRIYKMNNGIAYQHNLNIDKKETILQIHKAYYLTDLIRSFHKIVHHFCTQNTPHDPVRHQKLPLNLLAKDWRFPKKHSTIFFFSKYC